MIEILLFSSDLLELSALKKKAEQIIGSMNHTLLSFGNVMDMMDYIHSSRPDKMMIFFSENSVIPGIEASLKIYSMNPKSRFCLIRRDAPDDLEAMFFNGVSYYVPSVQDDVRLARCFRRFFDFYDESYNKMLMLKNKAGEQAIPIRQILYCMSDKRKVIFVGKERSWEFYYKLDEIEKMAGNNFLRCHQSYLVNMDRIEKFVEDGLLLTSGDFVPVSRKKYFSSKRAYLSYVTDSKEPIL